MWPKEGEKIRHGALCIFIFLLTISILSLAEGRIGYDISVTVNDSNNSTSWSRGHFISAYEFNSESHCKGDGNSSKYIFIKGLDDVSLKENTHTKEGRLKEDSLLSAGSSINFVSIEEAVSDNAERYNVKINESMPSYLMSVEETMYRGEGLHKRNIFQNHDDKMMTSYHAKKFSESSAFAARYRNALIMADVVPSGVDEFAGENHSSMLRFVSESDIYSGFKFKSPDRDIEEDYVGSFKISKKVASEHSFQFAEDDIGGMLDCCPATYPGLDYSLRAAWSCLLHSMLNDSSLAVK